MPAASSQAVCQAAVVGSRTCHIHSPIWLTSSSGSRWTEPRFVHRRPQWVLPNDCDGDAVMGELVMRSCLLVHQWLEHRQKMDMVMLRNVQGVHAPLRLQMEENFAQQVCVCGCFVELCRSMISFLDVVLLLFCATFLRHCARSGNLGTIIS